MTRTLHVVTHRRWVADELAAGASARPDLDVVVRHHLGMDLPAFEPGDALWSPMEWAIRAAAPVGPPESADLLLLADPGARWMTSVPVRFLSRTIRVTTLAETATAAPEQAFFKPANCKIERLPAIWTTRDDFVADARGLGLPDDSLILTADRFLPLVEEHRVYVLHGCPVTSSVYLQRDITGSPASEVLWHEDMTSARSQDALDFAVSVLTALDTGTGTAQSATPPAMVLDVALVAETPDTIADESAGRWVVLEANPVWSAGFYGADPGLVVECLLAANTPLLDAIPTPATGWDWDPDPWLIARARMQRSLQRSLERPRWPLTWW